MNRRDLLMSLFPAVAAACGGTEPIVSTIESAPAETDPLCLVVSFHDDHVDVPVEITDRIKATIQRVIGPKCPPVIVLAPGMRLEVIGQGASS